MAEQAPRRLTLTVTPAMAGEKIDTLLRRELHLSGTVIRRSTEAASTAWRRSASRSSR